jgi:hypothetical protein
MELDTFGMSCVTVTLNIRVNQNIKCENMSRKLIGETVHSNNSEHQMGYKVWNGIR